MKIRVFILSALLHTTVILLCVGLQLTVLADIDKRVTSAMSMALVCLVGAVKGARYARLGYKQHIAGAIVAGVSITMIGAWLVWGLTYPVGEPVPLGEYLSKVFQKDANALWLVAPTLVIVVASVAGAEIAIRVRQMLSGSDVPGDRPV